MDVPEWKWNLKKILMYKPDNGLTGRVLCLDLDMIILGSLDDMARYNDSFITCAAPFNPHKVRIGGSMIGFDAGYGEEELWNPLMCEETYKHIEKITRGSERIYYRMRLDKDNVNFWQHKFPGQVLSYKHEIGEGGTPPADTRIVMFHGLPRPHERLELKWVKDNWK